MKAMVCGRAHCLVRLKRVKDREALIAWYRLRDWRAHLENAARVWAVR